jgi:hypothetical protein
MDSWAASWEKSGERVRHPKISGISRFTKWTVRTDQKNPGENLI